jgi:DNA-binding response OmpR family regulator
MAIVDMLEMAGHDAEEASDGESALRRLEANGRMFDIMISDVALPGLSGEDLAVRVHDCWPSVRIVLVSGRDRVNLPAHLDSVLFLPKPFQFEDLLKVVET